MRRYHALKLFRIVFAVIAISLISLTFFDIYAFMSSDTARYIALTQFIPSMLSFMHMPSLVCISFFAVIFLTFVSGRIYCSCICPFGIFQDACARIGKILRIAKGYHYTAPHNLIRYAIFFLVILSYFFSGTVLIVWLDPFSLYGRFASNILSPAVKAVNNLASGILIHFNIYSLHAVTVRYPETAVLGVIMLMTVTVIILALCKGRFFCNTVCPVGALLGAAAKLSFFKIRIDTDRCIHCGMCEKNCRSSCIDHAAGYVDVSRCVSCFTCLAVCPNASIQFKALLSGKTASLSPDRDSLDPHRSSATIKRRAFLSGIVFIPSVISAQTAAIKQKLYVQDAVTQKYFKKKIFASPPGSLNIDAFNDRCTACSLCITKCPSAVLQPAVLQYGLQGMMQPYLDFNTGYCNYDCTICSNVCPAGAIGSITVAEKHRIQTGKSFFVKENCITYTNGIVCGACSEHCPTKAVKMIPFKRSLVIPEVNQKICIGCGACEYVCPVRPLKAMYVEGSRIHEKADLPRIITPKEKKKINVKDDFPF